MQIKQLLFDALRMCNDCLSISIHDGARVLDHVAVLLVHSIRLSLLMFERTFSKQSRALVMQHFEDILKTIQELRVCGAHVRNSVFACTCVSVGDVCACECI